VYNFTGSICASQEAMCRNYCEATGSKGNITIGAAFSRPMNSSQHISHDGVVDTLKNFMMHEYFTKLWSEVHTLTVMLTESF